MNICGDSIRVVHSLFQEEDDGSIPISPLQLEVSRMYIKDALLLNDLWHSRLPNLTNWQGCVAYGSFYENKYYACAVWGRPIAREFNGRNYYELRRMAIADDAPKNTASRMIKLMRLDIKKTMPEIVKLISYQDTDVHHWTIYKASGCVEGGRRKGGKQAWTSNQRKRANCPASGDKIRWEYDLHK